MCLSVGSEESIVEYGFEAGSLFVDVDDEETAMMGYRSGTKGLNGTQGVASKASRTPGLPYINASQRQT